VRPQQTRQSHPTVAMERLPETTEDQVAQLQAEYHAAFQSGSHDELEAAKCRCRTVP
jgi:hypothetical protein